MLVSCIVETGHTPPAWRHRYVSLWRFAQGSYKRWPLPPTAAHSSAYLAPVRKSFNQSHRPLGWLQPLWHLILLTTFSGSSPFLGTLPILFACFFYYLYLPFSGCCFSRFHCSFVCVCVGGVAWCSSFYVCSCFLGDLIHFLAPTVSILVILSS